MKCKMYCHCDAAFENYGITLHVYIFCLLEDIYRTVFCFLAHKIHFYLLSSSLHPEVVSAEIFHNLTRHDLLCTKQSQCVGGERTGSIWQRKRVIFFLQCLRPKNQTKK